MKQIYFYPIGSVQRYRYTKSVIGEKGMERKVGTVSRGIRCPIIRQGDDLVKIVVDSVLEAAESEITPILKRLVRMFGIN